MSDNQLLAYVRDTLVLQREGYYSEKRAAQLIREAAR